ncbi:nucleotide pyrophosphohydrolase [Deinococcus deserti]|uniref:Putative pyrophosphatase n=1 Tax=Deinococcus deserti (strain DSM 17065 / CIP 109153 / LMG 22923 / VCD115) TaxID=546414 RepID=C1CXC4_DEIDV|nr:nucleotide pyrophosphohydrolase [Deinococcus deserti]ACO46841.1 putative pyrophosphatase [Deinococcus deserti VCD115]
MTLTPGDPLTFAQASRRVDAFISQFEEGYFPPLLMLARLTEEVGEIARVVSHMNGKKPKAGEEPGDLEMELADLLFVTLCMANERGLDLERGFERMMAKIEQRDATRWTKKQDQPDEFRSGELQEQEAQS